MKKIINSEINSQGFSLIETIVYLALFAIFLGGSVATSYNMFELSGRSQTKSLVQEEGNFLQAKIEWALTGAQTITSPSQPIAPAIFTQSSILSVTKYDGSSIVIKLSGSDMQLQNSVNTFILNNSSVKVSQLVFTHNYSQGDGVNPESLDASFTLTAKTPNGADFSQSFVTTKYLRK